MGHDLWRTAPQPLPSLPRRLPRCPKRSGCGLKIDRQPRAFDYASLRLDSLCRVMRGWTYRPLIPGRRCWTGSLAPRRRHARARSRCRRSRAGSGPSRCTPRFRRPVSADLQQRKMRDSPLQRTAAPQVTVAGADAETWARCRQDASNPRRPRGFGTAQGVGAMLRAYSDQRRGPLCSGHAQYGSVKWCAGGRAGHAAVEG